MSSIEENEKRKSKKKRNIMITVSSIIVVIPIIFALSSAFDLKDVAIKKIGVDDFPLEMFDQGHQILCMREKTLSCVIKNDGIIELKIEDGLYRFKTKDFSLIKYYSKQTGTELKSVEYPFYQEGLDVELVDTNTGYSIWLVKAKGA